MASKPAPRKVRRPIDWRAVGRAVLRIAGSAGRRAYALALIGVIVLLSGMAIRYLVVSIAWSAGTPPQIADVPRRLDRSLLHESRPDWLGLQAVQNPRAPLAHYHRFDAWIEPDPFNDCARSGCHSPLPHSKSQALRAFLNMHATSLHCGVCHMQSDASPLPLTWYALNDGRPRDPPALLRAYAELESIEPATSMDAATRARIVESLSAADRETSGALRLASAIAQIRAARPGGEALTALLIDVREIIRRSFRGSYGARLALRDPEGKPVLAHPGARQAVADWLARGATAAGAERERMLAAVHPRRRDTPLACTDCHADVAARIDFDALGYTPARMQALRDRRLTQMIQHIAEGRPFYLPVFGESAASQPAPQPVKTP